MKTFDEFKKHYGAFIKNHTPETDAICEAQYKLYLIREENSRFFEPLEISSENDSLNRYTRNLHQLIGFGEVPDNQLYILITPSFEPESLMVLEQAGEKYKLVTTVLKENYWQIFYENNSITDIDKITTYAELKAVMGDKLVTLLSRTIEEARKAKPGWAVLDGTVYTLAKRITDETKRVFKHSPDPDSPSGKIVSIIEKLFEHRDTMSEDTLTLIEGLIDDVLSTT